MMRPIKVMSNCRDEGWISEHERAAIVLMSVIERHVPVDLLVFGQNKLSKCKRRTYQCRATGPELKAGGRNLPTGESVDLRDLGIRPATSKRGELLARLHDSESTEGGKECPHKQDKQ